MPQTTTPGHAFPPAAAGLRVRRAVAADLGRLVQLENDTFQSDRLSERQWAHHLGNERAEILVAVDGDRLVGALVLFLRCGSDIARLYSLAIDAAARGRGIGSLLLSAGERAARRRGCLRLRLEVRRDNRAARRLYEGREYRIIGERVAYYADGEDAVRYEKTLGAA